MIVFYKGDYKRIYNELLLFIKNRGVFFQKNYLSPQKKSSEFRSFLNDGQDLFLSSLSDSFKNHDFVFVDEDVVFGSVFDKKEVLERFEVKDGSKKEDLLSCLCRLGYKSVDLVERRGEFCARGFVVDFFPFGYRFGVRVVFDERVEVFSFDVKTQLVVAPLNGFCLTKSDVINKITNKAFKGIKNINNSIILVLFL